MENIDYITPIKKQLDEALEHTCIAYKLMGNGGNETPRYYNYRNFRNGCLRIGSTQKRDLYFDVEIPEDLWKNYISIHRYPFCEQFREYRDDYIIKNHPTINMQ